MKLPLTQCWIDSPEYRTVYYNCISLNNHAVEAGRRKEEDPIETNNKIREKFSSPLISNMKVQVMKFNYKNLTIVVDRI